MYVGMQIARRAGLIRRDRRSMRAQYRTGRGMDAGERFVDARARSRHPDRGLDTSGDSWSRSRRSEQRPMPSSPSRLRTALHARLQELRTAAILVRSRPFDVSTVEGRANERYRRNPLTTVASVLTRVVGGVVSLVVMPLVLTYLGKEQFGLWAAITSTVAWVGLFDFGLANGLVNAVSEANGREDRAAAREYVSTALGMLAAAALVLGVVAAAGLGAVRWDLVLGADGRVPADVVRASVGAALAVVIVGLPLSIVHQVYAGYLKVVRLVRIRPRRKRPADRRGRRDRRLRGSLPMLVLVFGGATVCASLANLAWLVLREMPWLRPSLAAVSRRALHRLTATSTPLFLFQLGALLVNGTQNVVLARCTGLGTVADYSILWRLYVVVMSIILMSTSSFVPSFREAVRARRRCLGATDLHPLPQDPDDARGRGGSLLRAGWQPGPPDLAAARRHPVRVDRLGRPRRHVPDRGLGDVARRPAQRDGPESGRSSGSWS